MPRRADRYFNDTGGINEVEQMKGETYEGK